MLFKRAGYLFTVAIFCLVSAAVTLMFLSYVGYTARLRVNDQYTEPDYVRYLNQGYAFDTVSQKKNILITVTDGDLPVRVQIMTVDTDKNTLDILDIPPDSFVIADGFSGTLREAYTTPVYREIISRVFCLKIDGAAALSAESFGGAAGLLKVSWDGQDISYDQGKSISEDGFSYSRGDEKSVSEYHLLVGLMLEKISDGGAAESFSTLMNLIANRVETGMSVEDMIAIFNDISDISTKKMNIRIAKGYPAKFGSDMIWCLDPDGTAEQLNEYFRVKDTVYLPEALGIPRTETGKDPFERMEEKISDIIKEAK